MYVSGLSQAEIARRMGYSPSSISRMIDTPEFREYAQELQRDLRSSSLGSLTDAIEREAMPSLETITRIRDGSFDEPQVGRVQLDAAKFLLGDLHMDRKVPKVTKQENDGVLHVSFGQDALRQMLTAQAEAQGREVIDVEFEPGEGGAARVALPAPSHRTDLNDDAPPRVRAREKKKKRLREIKPIVAQPINEVLDELEDDDETARKTGTGEY